MLAEREAAFDAQRATYELELERIDRFKQIETVTPFDVFELREALQRANTAAEALQVLDADVRAAAEALDARRSALVAGLREEIARREARFATLGPNEVMAELAEMNALQRRVAALSRPVEVEATGVPLDEILADLPETAEEMWAAADELDDHAARLQRELETLRRQLDDALVQARLADRVSEFGMEESLFDDGAGRRSPVRSGATGAVAADDDTANGAQDEGDGAVVSNAGNESTSGGMATDDMANEAPSRGDGGAEPGASDGFEAGGGAPDPDPSMPPETDSAGSLDGPVETGGLGASISDPEVGVGSAVRVQTDRVAGTEDPTVVGAGMIEERARRSGSRRVDELRQLEAELQQQLDAVRTERDRLRQTADLLDR